MTLAASRPSRIAAARGLQSNAGVAIACALGNGLFLILNDTFAKLVSEVLPVGELITIRGLALTAIIFAYLAATRQIGLLGMSNWPAMALYCGTMVASTHLFLNSLTLMPLGDASAITFAAPIFTTALAALILREQVGWRRWGAVGIGFVGVAILLAPAGQGYTPLVAMMPLSVALLVSLRDIASRRLSIANASIGILFYNSLAVALSGFGALPFETWVMPGTRELLFMLAAAILVGLAQYLIVEAYRLAELSFVMPFRYVTLVFAALAGFLVWGDVPTWNVVLGAGIICASGLFIWYRERIRRPSRARLG